MKKNVLILLSVLVFNYSQAFALELEPYPKLGSIASAKDFVALHYYQRTRTEQDCEKANSHVNLSVKNLYLSSGLVSEEELDGLKAKFLYYKIRSGLQSQLAKRKFKRPRPYTVDKTLRPCIKKLPSSYAYPSGHTIISRVYAIALGRLFPDRTEAFLEKADEVALYRVIGGVHHPTDIIAGKLLADELAMKLFEE